MNTPLAWQLAEMKVEILQIIAGLENGVDYTPAEAARDLSKVLDSIDELYHEARR